MSDPFKVAKDASELPDTSYTMSPAGKEYRCMDCHYLWWGGPACINCGKTGTEVKSQQKIIEDQLRRERIATAAMQGQFASFNNMNWDRFHANRQESMKTIAIVAVEQADALIAQLDKRELDSRGES